MYAPLLCVAMSGALLGRRVLRNTAVSSAWWFGVAYVSVYLFYQFVLGRFVIETFYYFAHLTVVVYLLVPVVLGESTQTLSPRARWIVLAAAAGALLSVPLINHWRPSVGDELQGLTQANMTFLIRLVLLAALITSAARLLARRSVTACASVVAFMLLLQTFTFLSPSHRGVFDSRRRDRETDLYLATTEMLDVFAAHATPQTMVMLWYCSLQPSLGSIASSVLLFTLQRPFSSDRQACDGSVGDYELRRLSEYPVRYVLMLDEGGSSFPARESALQEAGYTTRTIRTETIGANACKANLRLIQISAPEP